jgi:hypothetical protein
MPSAVSQELRRLLLQAGTAEIEYAPIKVSSAIFSLSRSAIVELIESHQIRATHFKRPGSAKGVWLVHVATLRDFLRAREEPFVGVSK